jgi:flagellar hook-basal body complex protein FliE
MKLGPIDASRIEAMAARLQAAARAPAAPAMSAMPTAAAAVPGGTKVTFSDSLRVMLDRVNEQQLKADGLTQRFAVGDEKVNLSDVMIERQKASLSLQATVQVRNKLVSAYHEIMNMQV